MVAPLDAKVTFEVEGEPITLRLNFRSCSLAEQSGINPFNLDPAMAQSPTKMAILVKCLSVQDHPDFTEDHAMAIALKAPVQLANAIGDLFELYGGKVEGEAEGNGEKKAA